MYGREYDSPLHSLRPCWTAFLNSLRATLLPLETLNAVRSQLSESVCQHTASYSSRTAWRILSTIIREAQLPDVNSITAEKGLERQSRSQSRMLLS
jgi:hypothetical protein